jgi:hypothetical protein
MVHLNGNEREGWLNSKIRGIQPFHYNSYENEISVSPTFYFESFYENLDS